MITNKKYILTMIDHFTKYEDIPDDWKELSKFIKLIMTWFLAHVKFEIRHTYNSLELLITNDSLPRKMRNISYLRLSYDHPQSYGVIVAFK